MRVPLSPWDGFSSSELRWWVGYLNAFNLLLLFTLCIVGCAHCFLYALCHEGASIVCTSYAVIQWFNGSYRSVVGTSHVRCHMVDLTFIDHYYHIFHGFESIPWFRLFGVCFFFRCLKVLFLINVYIHSGWFWCFMALPVPSFRIAFL